MCTAAPPVAELARALFPPLPPLPVAFAESGVSSRWKPESAALADAHASNGRRGAATRAARRRRRCRSTAGLLGREGDRLSQVGPELPNGEAEACKPCANEGAERGSAGLRDDSITGLSPGSPR